MSDDKRLTSGGRLGLSSRLMYHMLHALGQLLAFMYFRVYAHRPTKLPRKGAVIISPVHRSNLDVPLLGITCPRRLRYLAKGSLFKNPFWTWLLTLFGGFPLDREARADRGALNAAMNVLERGEALVVFPEGERKAGPWVHPMLDGAAWLSVKSGAPILPVGIGGSERAMPKGATVPKPRKVIYPTATWSTHQRIPMGRAWVEPRCARIRLRCVRQSKACSTRPRILPAPLTLRRSTGARCQRTNSAG